MMQNERMTAEAESLSEQEKTGSSAQAKELVLTGKGHIIHQHGKWVKE